MTTPKDVGLKAREPEVLRLEVRQTARRWSPVRGTYGGKCYFSLADKDGDPEGVAWEVGKLFEHGDKLVLLRESDYLEMQTQARGASAPDPESESRGRSGEG